MAVQQHLDRLSAVGATFLAQEKPNTPFLAGERALDIAVMSYDGKVGFGVLGDYDALPDLDVVAEGIEASLAQLLALATPRPGD